MNIIIPIGGLGSRFSQDGYRLPKPLILALGKPILSWTLESIKPQINDIIYIIYREDFKKLSFEHYFTKNFPNYNIKFTTIHEDTRGASETVLKSIDIIDKERLNQLTLVIDSDNFYTSDIIKCAKKINNNSIFYIKDTNQIPIYSYIRTDNENKVIEIKEKEKISDNACVGAYCFKNGFILQNIITRIINKNKKQKNEFYISTLYDELIENGESVTAIELSEFQCLGTPTLLKNFCYEQKYKYKKQNILVQLDKILLSKKIEKQFVIDNLVPIFQLINKISRFGVSISFVFLKNSQFEIIEKDIFLNWVIENKLEINKKQIMFLSEDDFNFDLKLNIDHSSNLENIEKEVGFYL